MSDETPPEGVVSATSDADGITIVRILDAPREEVFRAWTEREGMAAWFGEEGSSIPLETFTSDPRPGGAWHLIMIHGPDRIEIPFSGRFVEIVEPERVALTIADPTLTDSEREEVLTAVLEDIGDGRTRMTFTQRGGNLGSDEYSRAMRGELIFFDRLAVYLKTRHEED
jgi:uncharacterized protein YndB with AHSA1/START domain